MTLPSCLRPPATAEIAIADMAAARTLGLPMCDVPLQGVPALARSRIVKSNDPPLNPRARTRLTSR